MSLWYCDCHGLHGMEGRCARAECIVGAPESPTIDDPAPATLDSATYTTEDGVEHTDTSAPPTWRCRCGYPNTADDERCGRCNREAPAPSIRPARTKGHDLCTHAHAERYAVAAGKAAIIASEKITDEKLGRAMGAYGQIVDGMRAEIVGSIIEALEAAVASFDDLQRRVYALEHPVRDASSFSLRSVAWIPTVLGVCLAALGFVGSHGEQLILFVGGAVCFAVAFSWWGKRR